MICLGRYVNILNVMFSAHYYHRNPALSLLDPAMVILEGPGNDKISFFF